MRYSKAGFSAGSGYVYTNTRVKARKSLLLKPEEFLRFMKMSLPEIANYLGQGMYKREIEELGLKFKGTNLIEYALNRNLEHTFHDILGFSIGAAQQQIPLYLMRYDVANIKTILRGKYSQASDETVRNQLIACGELSRELLESVIKNSSGMRDAIEFFKGTEYYPVLKSHGENLSRLEDELDKVYYSKVLSAAESDLRDYINYEVLIKNTLNRLRGKRSNIRVELLPEKRHKEIKLPSEEDNPETRVYCKKLLVKRGLRMVSAYSRNIRPILGYFVAKENEVNNIRVIVRGKHAGLADETIVKELVI